MGFSEGAGDSVALGVCAFPVSVTGEPAIASLRRSSLLNLALDCAKSKSESGTSTFPVGRPPRPRPRGAVGALVALTLISLTLLVKLSMALPPPLPSWAMAAATAALAALVASWTLFGAVEVTVA